MREYTQIESELSTEASLSLNKLRVFAKDHGLRISVPTNAFSIALLNKDDCIEAVTFRDFNLDVDGTEKKWIKIIKNYV